MDALATRHAEGFHGHDHRVEFYETDAFLTRTVVEFATPALSTGDAVVLVATAEHRAGFTEALSVAGVDVAAAIAEDRLIVLDADATLRAFMVGRAPDRRRFRRTMGAVLDRAAAGGRRVRVYGEMVALLWERHQVEATIALEDLWNDLGAARDFLLLCAYPLRAFGEAQQAGFRHICGQHGTVIPAEDYTLASGEDERRRVVAALQQEAAALRVGLERMRRAEESLTLLAFVDELTGLPNRRAFDRRLQDEWASAVRDGVDSVVIVADLDGFKRINDRRGHAAGDRALRDFGAALRSATRGTDHVARLGGDEFGIVLSRCAPEIATTFDVRLRAAMAGALGAEAHRIGVSLGHASLLGAPSAPAALERADLAMLARKHAAVLR
ncbi:diguanylate cyclase domain-containing protein [Patulibacter minatonensis]|uniref:diguanylate cyclase domain-containing protein n=1 Tax=Patulibacter minatonensis TaxID=298163 RepID=UPI000683E11F|nr:diguanylate cyclase [Patulibacter minatonensis]